jgi:hypothetical protein
MAVMRIAGFGLQPDLHRDGLDGFANLAALDGLGANPQHVLLTHGEVHVYRAHLHDRRQAGGRGPDQVADRHQMSGHFAIEWRQDPRVAVVDGGELGVGLGLSQVRLRGVALGPGVIQVLHGRHRVPLQ